MTLRWALRGTAMTKGMTEAMQAAEQFTRQRLGSLIEATTREMPAKPGAAAAK